MSTIDWRPRRGSTPTRRPGEVPRRALCVVVLCLITLAHGAGTPPPNEKAIVTGCRTTNAAAPDAPPLPIRWVLPADAAERQSLDRWCEAVGPVVVSKAAASEAASGIDDLAVVSWNLHVGAGDLDSLVHHLREGAFSGGKPVRHIVLLLQEAHRAGSLVPQALRTLIGVPGAILPGTGNRTRQDIATVAARLGLNVYYVPSMRNGGPLKSDEDRGNAILSTLPLADLTAIELPFVRQRRVVIAAQLDGHTTGGEPWTLRVVSVHLDNLVGLRSVWIFSGPARQRQARGLLGALPGEGPEIVAGDFNTWFGYRDPAYGAMAAAFPHTAVTDRRATFAGLLRLDHMFFRLPADWTSSFARLNDRFGSDHYPLLGWVHFRHAGESLRPTLPPS